MAELLQQHIPEDPLHVAKKQNIFRNPFQADPIGSKMNSPA
jgi:hypothetical protein